MNKKIVAFFVCSFIALLVNCTPIDSADDGVNLPIGRNIQYEEPPMPTGTIFVSTIPSLVSHPIDETLNSGKSEGSSTVTTGINTHTVSLDPITTPPSTLTNTTNTETTTTLPTTKPTTTVTLSPPPIPTPPVTTPPPTTTTIPTIPTTSPAITTPKTTTTNATTPGTTTAAASTTPTPVPTAAPSKDRRFDGPSFIGGIVLSLGIMAIGFVAWKFYKARTERNYHTL